MDKETTLKLLDVAMDAIAIYGDEGIVTWEDTDDIVALCDLLRYDIEDGKISSYDYEKMTRQEKLIYTIAEIYFKERK